MTDIMTPRERTIADMVSIAERHGMTLDKAMKSKKHSAARVRCEIAHFLVMERGKALSEAARIMGMSNHATIIYQVGRHLMHNGMEDHPIARRVAKQMARQARYHLGKRHARQTV